MAHLDSSYLRKAFVHLRCQGIRSHKGLTDAEVERAEAVHSFRFPPDLRAFLQYRMPVGDEFPDWRDPGSEALRERFAWPADSMCFDVEHDHFWLEEWGERPDALEQAFEVARAAAAAGPALVPVFGHRYLPASPCAVGNPVLSVYQTDIIYYGSDLPDYLQREFGVPNPYPVPEPPSVEFWGRVGDL